VDKIKQYQKFTLMNVGLRDNPGKMAIFLLKNVHGLRVPKATEYSSDEKPLLIAFE